jgi:hypothetical protein
MKLSQLSLADYNQLDSIPVINQDLSASGFTPVANTYYRHTGATTDTFTQGVIYLYDTAYHKLGESGGGTTLNKYEWTITNGFDSAKAMRLSRIFNNSKGKVRVFSNNTEVDVDMSSTVGTSSNQKGVFYSHSDFYTSEYVLRKRIYNLNGNLVWTGYITVSADGKLSNGHSDTTAMEPTKVVYYNDTEIT